MHAGGHILSFHLVSIHAYSPLSHSRHSLWSSKKQALKDTRPRSGWWIREARKGACRTSTQAPSVPAHFL